MDHSAQLVGPLWAMHWTVPGRGEFASWSWEGAGGGGRRESPFSRNISELEEFIGKTFMVIREFCFSHFNSPVEVLRFLPYFEEFPREKSDTKV